MKERQSDTPSRSPFRVLWLIAGAVAMGLGAVGVVLPVLPTTPFLLLASFCFAKGSKRFHLWFTGTKLYKRHLESFVRSRAMTLKTKFSLLIPASCMLLFAFWLMPNWYGRGFILFLIVFKYVYFFTRIRTIPAGTVVVAETEE
ncbi:MAG: YbaN family protein [Eubacteriales bacterium]|nr:YbaN family protein [Eubacteriales bacterium]